MKRLVIIIGIVCFLSMSSLGQATEIIKTPLNQEGFSNLIVKEDKLLMSVNPDDIHAGGVGRAFAAIGIGVATGLIIYALLTVDTTDNNN